LYLPALQKLRREIELYACTNRTRAKAVAYSRLAGIPRVVRNADELLALPEVDAVIVSLPIDLQPPVVRAALSVGKPVLSEKPIAPSTAVARELVKLARRHGTPWLVAENYAFLEGVLRLEGWIRAGRLGDVFLAEARQFVAMDGKNPYFHTAWRKRPRFAGSFVLDAGVHLAHGAPCCASSEPDEPRNSISGTWICSTDAARGEASRPATTASRRNSLTLPTWSARVLPRGFHPKTRSSTSS
jgi:predicted dehydrogenase